MRKIWNDNGVRKGEAITEFGMALPLFLLVIFGIIGFGHMFFNYILVASAAREAARTGSGVGVSDSGTEYYLDCDTIKAAAKRVGAYAGIKDSDITITYDHGSTDEKETPVYCETADSGDVVRGDRIGVEITVQYTPIVPLPMLGSMTIKADSFRTIIK